jgi:hypothetical protein
MELDLDTKHLLAKLIEKPAMVSHAHVNMLSELIQKYPYYQPLHFLLAKATVNESNAKEMLSKASFYTNGNILYKVIHSPETLTVGNDEISAVAEDQEITDHIAPITTPPLDQEELEEDEVFEEIAEVDSYPTENFEPKAAGEQEVYDEIVEVDSSDFAMDSQVLQEENLVMENIVATDFFAFEEGFTTEQPVTKANDTDEVTHPEEYNLEAEKQTVTNYNDDKLPYTFLWWLAKTRKEHEQIFQPYVTQKKTEPSPTGELQQQYVEHIFHIQSAFNEIEENSIGPLNRAIFSKGNDIIDTFIKNDPQIKAPKADQINTENKAKKSAEDHNDLVSETLAAIYIEQMLYHKAIDTYEKLSLKFPEKSRYFADLIQSLEKKI